MARGIFSRKDGGEWCRFKAEYANERDLHSYQQTWPDREFRVFEYEGGSCYDFKGLDKSNSRQV